MPDKRPTRETQDKTNPAGICDVQYQVITGGQWLSIAGAIVEESIVSIFANGKEIANMMATPQHQEYLAVGYLYTEGLINNRQEILAVNLAPNGTCVDVLLSHSEIALPPRRVLTSGCGSGVTFASHQQDVSPSEGDVAQPNRLTSEATALPSDIRRFVRDLQQASQLHRRAGGIHAAGLATQSGLAVVMEDIGRHNTLDKVAGYCLMNGIDPTGHTLLTTGRISSDMVNKALRMQLPIIASLTSPTSLAVERAHTYNLTLVGYVRGRRMRVYTHPERIQPRGETDEHSEDQD
jgi:FdhD protein